MIYLSGGEEGLEKLDRCTHKSHIGQPEVSCSRSSGMHTRTLDVHANEIGFGKTASQCNCILSFATPQFKHYRPIVAEEIAVPATSQRKCRAVGHIGGRHRGTQR